MLQNRGPKPTMVAAALLLALTSGGCSIAQDRTCFTKRPGVVLPDRAKVLANVSNGGSGRLLVEAVLDGQHDKAAAMLARDPRLLQTVVTHDPRMDAAPAGQAGDLLTLAVSRCDREMIDMLLKAGMPANGTKVGNALSLALLADTPDMAEALLKAGGIPPDPQQLDGGEDAMAAAMAFSHPGAVMTLLRHGADPRYADAFGVDRVREAVGTEQTDIAEILVKAGASLWTVAEDGSTAVHDLARPAMLFKTPELKAARDRLFALAENQARVAIPLAPPDRATIKRMMVSGQWPTAAMLKVGMAPSPQALARMKTP